MTKKVKIDQINIDNIINNIYKDVYESSHHASNCFKCSSTNIKLINENEVIYKCEECKNSFSPRTNSLFQKIRLNNNNWIKFLKCMINDSTLEETVKVIETNAESVKRRWNLIYNAIDWDKYEIEVRSEPTKNIYANFDIIVG
ncbi:MAG: hypothetical protein ACRC42_01205 [Mycoplasma sp.]